MQTIPIYALFGEAALDSAQDWLHWETIRSRSSQHDFRIAPHRHEQFFQVLQLHSGMAQVVLDGATLDLAGPAVVTVPALAVHGYVFSRNVEGLVLTLMERDMRAAAREVGGVLERPIVLTERLHDVNAAIAQLVSEGDRRGPGHGTAMAALISLLLVALQRAEHISAAVAQAESDRAVAHAQTFRTLVDSRFRESRAIAPYAAALGISPTHLNRISRQVLGASALKVIERRIALEAKRQMLFSSLTIKAIGEELGYADPAYFTRSLTRMLGMAPTVYRRAMRATR